MEQIVKSRLPSIALVLLAFTMLGTPAVSAAAAETCVAPGGWINAEGRPAAAAAVLRRAATAPVVVLGETHESAEDHRWQIQTLAGLYALNQRLAIGMEAFPRRLQPILDRWSAGELDEGTFLKLTQWDKVWGYDAGYYLPIMHFARMNRLPLIALNVERSLVSRVARQGWVAVPADEREGVGDPAPVTEGYLRRLEEVAAGHGGQRGSPDFQRFVAAQSLWDRAMAEAAAAQHRRDGRTVVAIMGRGHAEYRDGVIRQLDDLGLGDSVVLLPWAPGRPCNQPGALAADALFGVASPQIAAAPRPRLGVELREADGGVAVATVAPGSIAARAGLKAGDVITAAAGSPMRAPSDVSKLVRATPPGAWLPLEVRRGGATRNLIAKLAPAANGG